MLLVLVVGRVLPESPRRLMTHGRMEEAEHVVGEIERTVKGGGFALMASQAFVYNAVVFTYALAPTIFDKVPSGSVGYYILPFALANFIGPLLLGRLSTSSDAGR